MNNKRVLLKLSILLICIINPDLKAEYKFEGGYKSEFLLPFNKSYAGDLKCPKKLPIKIELKVDGNKITGNISNSSKCPNYQRALIKGEIDDEGNIVKIKFNHYDKKWGSKDDAYKIVGNLSGQLILKSKQRMMYKDYAFFFNAQNLSDIDEQFIDERKNKDLRTKIKIINEPKKNSIKELEEKKLKEQQKEQKLREEKRIKKQTNLLFN